MATELVTLAQESSRQNDFYVPQFAVKIEGANLPRDVLRDVLRITYKDNVTEIDSFEMTVNNWDPDTNDFKYVGSRLETADELQRDSELSKRFRLFEPSNKAVNVTMGYQDIEQQTLMLTGNFTTMEPSFTGGPPTLTVRGLNVLHLLRRKQYTTSWTGKKDSEIAENLATLRDDGQRRFPLPIYIDSNAKQKEPIIPIVSQRQQFDIDFLLTRARQRGYVVYVLEEDRRRKLPKRLYFGPSNGSVSPGIRDVTFKLEWGKSLMEFKPTLSTAQQVHSVTVKGWNRQTRQLISETATLSQSEINNDPSLRNLLQRCEPRTEVVTDEPVFTQSQARTRALALLRERQKEMVLAEGATVGLPDLRAGRQIQIGGLGARFNGLYFVLNTTHSISDAGYITRFSARRESEGNGTGGAT